MADEAAASKKTADEVVVKPTIGILSIGEMGLGIAKLLISNGYTVTTCTAGRSQTTVSRIKSASIQGYATDAEFVGNSDIILSIVPPRDAIATAKRVARAAQDGLAIEARAVRDATSADSLLYIDLNAISPLTAQRIAQILNRRPKSALIISGPPTLTTAPFLPPPLQTLLNITIVSPTIGHASTLKCSFASLTKGLTAIATLSFTTAHSQSPSLLPHLVNQLEQHAPSLHKFLIPSLPKMPPKAYRWIDEMHEIGQTFSAPVDQYGEIAEAVRDGVAAKQRRRHRRSQHAANNKSKEKDKLELAWRGSWT
ncbi:hypothetical protein DV738_g1726, partial [Chaetothyriales sp. CBS 135597]